MKDVIMYSCAIFDFDGTLADTNAGIVATFRKTTEVLGIPCPTDDEITATIGLPLKQNFLVAIPGIEESLADECVVTYRRLFDEIAIPVISLFPRVRETLEALRRRGVRLFIATSRSRRSLSMICTRQGILDYFEGLYTADDVTRHKPAPDIVELILANAGLPAADALVIGDTTFDLMMGHAAGCPACGVTYGNHSRARLLESDPEYLVDCISEVLPLFGCAR